MTVTTMPSTAEGSKEGGAQPRSKKKLLIAVVLVLGLGGAGWFFFLKPSAPEKPVPGEVLTIEAVQLNLAGGHYLRVGMALQLKEGAHEVDGSKALDAAITTYSGLQVSDVVRSEQRDALKADLLKELKHVYHGDVLDLYYTEFVTQ